MAPKPLILTLFSLDKFCKLIPPSGKILSILNLLSAIFLYFIKLKKPILYAELCVEVGKIGDRKIKFGCIILANFNDIKEWIESDILQPIFFNL